ncbi:phosphoglycerate mutase [Marinomonas primoryensis]|uniref:phosphoglycerate mutase (2,3-diphosphoglycerate-dependent) n=1 Tax=Marinomonas primoryensis TaxID=178399 RepID=A0A2Z4PNY7_9GAMM|nr:histidine phosphatase family protein [Marinomonas primoryensis]AWX99221.1 phosphoglycerate mutase [Marinomonas primoryensis]
MIARIALIRHGAYEQLENVPSALQPFPLTEEGEQEVRQQARTFGEWLTRNGLRLDPQVDSSTLLRAWQTAMIYTEELREYFDSEPQVVSFPALCERSVGAVANLPVEEIERVLALDPRFSTPPENWKSDSDYCLPFDGAESLLQAGQRVADHIQAWRSQHSIFEGKHEGDGLVKLLVGHGASIRHGAFHLSVIQFCDIKRLSMFYGHPIVLEFSNDQPIKKGFGEWKQRQTHDVPD